jgi:hypothetical protein
VLAAGLLFAAPAQALTIDEVIARAEQSWERVRAHRAEAAGEAFREEPPVDSPSVRVEVSRLLLGDVETETRLRLPVPRPMQAVTARRRAEADGRAEAAEVEADWTELRRMVVARFYALPVLRERAELAETERALRLELVDAMRTLRAAGQATVFDVLDAEDDRRRAEADAISARGDRDAAEAELRGHAALGPEPVVIDGDPRAFAATPWPLAVVELDPRCREAAAEVETARAELAALADRAIPWIDWGEVSLSVRPRTPVDLRVGVSIDVPIEYWAPGRTSAARARLAAAEAALDGVRRVVDADVQRGGAMFVEADASWRAAVAYRDAVAGEVAPLLVAADLRTRLELDARLARAEARERTALIGLIAARAMAADR